MVEELLPCPFCGAGAAMYSIRGDEGSGYTKQVKVYCVRCTANVSAYDETDKNGWSVARSGETEVRAVAAWNNRV